MCQSPLLGVGLLPVGFANKSANQETKTEACHQAVEAHVSVVVGCHTGGVHREADGPSGKDAAHDR